MTTEPINRLVLFGATGDLAGRFLLPALARLLDSGEIAADFEVTGTSRHDFDDEDYRSWAAERLAEHCGDLAADGHRALLSRLKHRPSDVADPASVGAVIGDTQAPVAVYLALPPKVFPTVLATLAEVGLPPDSAIVIEKPFGEDLESAIELNAQVAEATAEDESPAVYRIDHVLGLATVHNLIGTRLSNRVVEPLWNGAHIERIEILWDEVIGLEGRAGFYDHTGALEDVIQNHLLQLLALVAMERPSELSAAELHRCKADVLRAVRILDADDVPAMSRRGRYTAGTLAAPPDTAGRPVPSYVDEEGVDPDHDTETFAEILLEIDTPRWRDTQFLLRTGKALARRRKGVIARFRPVPALPGSEGEVVPPPNELRMGLDGPESFSLHLTGSAPGPPARMEPLELEADLPAHELPAYGHVILRALNRDDTLTISAEEAELSWRIVTPIIAAWTAGRVPMLDYPAGSTGPDDCLANPDWTSDAHPWTASI